MPDVERLLLSMIWSVKSNKGVLQEKDWVAVSNKVGSYFTEGLEGFVINWIGRVPVNER